MKALEIIAALQKLVAEHGDCEVVVYATEMSSSEVISIEYNQQHKWIEIR